jgi:hypothetical protein
MSAAAVQADYVDLKFIKSRSIAQVVLEIPIEQADAFVQAFGTPRPAEGVPCALARLGGTKDASEKTQREVNYEATEVFAPTPEKTKRDFDTLPLPQQAALLCDRDVFSAFLRKQRDIDGDPATAIRNICRVGSRADIKPGTHAGDAFIRLRDDFNTWMRTVS